MKFMAGLPIWLLASCARSEDNIVDSLLMFDKMDSTLGLFERNFGESVTKKLSFALFEGTQNIRSPMEIVSKFMQELTPEEIDSVSKGIISSIQELAEVLKQPGAQDQLNFYINAAPTIFATLSSLSNGGGYGYTDSDDKKDAIPAAKWNEGDSDPFESITRGKKKSRTIVDFKPPEVKDDAAEDMMELAGDLLKSGASLLGNIGSSVTEGSRKSGGGLMGFATKMIERMIEEGVLDEEFLESINPDADLEDGEEDLIEADQLTAEDPKKTKVPTQSKLPELPSKSTDVPENKEKDHLEL